MEKLLLIRTSWPADFFEVSHPMGLLYLSAYLEQSERYRIRLIDMRVGNKTPQGIRQEIRDYRPDFVGLGSLSYEAPCTHELARMVKEDFPETPVVVGGPYATSTPGKVLADSNVDFCVLGEGEATLSELLEEIEKGNTHPEIAGIGYRANGKDTITEQRSFVTDLDSLPFPAWHLIRLEDYYLKATSHQMHVRPEFSTIVTSRGCPYGCIYCHNMLGKKFRARSPENVLGELDIHYHQQGMRDLQIQDDVFNLIPARAKTICDLMMRRGIRMNISFPNGVRGDIMDEELLRKLKEAGTFKISYAAESGSERIQKLIRKNMNLPKLKKVIEQTDKLDIFAHGFFMLGFPTETLDEMRQTVEFALKSKLHSATFFVVNAFGGSELSKLMEQQGKTVDIRDNDYSYYSSRLQLSEVPSEDVAQMIQKANRAFYFNPARILRIFRLTPRKTQLLNYLFYVIKRAFVQR